MKHSNKLRNIVGTGLLPLLVWAFPGGMVSTVSAESLGVFFATAYHVVYESEIAGTQTVTLDLSGPTYTLKASFWFGGFGVGMQGF